MPLNYIIDGYNVIKHRLFPCINKSNKDPVFLLTNLIQSKRLCGSSKNLVRIVFDGFPLRISSGQSAENIKIIYSYDLSADDEIRKIIEAQQGHKSTVLVSDDREVTDHARIYSVKAISVESFLNPAIKDIAKVQSIKSGRNQDVMNKDLSFGQVNSINEELKKKWL